MAINTAIMGFGNPVRSDDGVGIYVIEKLRQILVNQTHITLLDMGTSAFETLFQLKGHQKIIIVDAVVNSGEKVGTIFQLPADSINSQLQDDPLVFLHSLKWDQALSYSKKILKEDYPKDIQVYLIAVENIKLEVGISPEVEASADSLVDKIFHDVMENVTTL